MATKKTTKKPINTDVASAYWTKWVNEHKELLSGHICSALESGSYATFGIVRYYKPADVDLYKEGDGTLFKHLHYPLSKGGSVVLYIMDEDRTKEHEHTLDLEALARGCQLMGEKYPKHWADLISEESDFFTGDCLVQCALLGDVVYG